MTPQEAREQFSKRLKDRAENRRKVNEDIETINKRLLVEFERAVLQKQQAAGKKRGKKHYSKILSQSEVDELKNKFKDEYDSLVSTSLSELNQIDAELAQLAEQAEIRPGSPTAIRTFRRYDFATQPNAAGYCRGVAATYAECYKKFNGVQAEVVHTTEPEEWVVFVNVATELDLEILRRRDEAPLKEVIRLLLKNGCNPKVINPYFPYPRRSASTGRETT